MVLGPFVLSAEEKGRHSHPTGPANVGVQAIAHHDGRCRIPVA
jgi:hypothetical protein